MRKYVLILLSLLLPVAAFTAADRVLDTGVLKFKEMVSAPASPSAGYVNTYGLTDGYRYFLDSTGTQRRILDIASFGTNGQLFRSTGSALGLTTSTFPSTNAAGDTFYGSGSNAWGTLSIGSANQLYGVNNAGTAPEYKAITGTADGALTAAGAIRSNTSLILEDPGAGSNTVTIQSATPSASYTLKLPVADGTIGQVLKTDGSGQLSFSDESGSGGGTSRVARFQCARPAADANTLLLAKFDEAPAYDYGPTHYAATQNNSATSGDTGQIKFGAGSFQQSSNENWQYSPAALGSGDFTIDFWAYNTNWTSAVSVSAGSIDNGGSYWILWYRTLSPVGITWSNPTGNILSGISPPSNSAWHHFAVVRSSGTLTMYIDGVSQASASDSRDYSTSTIRIGYSNTQAAGFSGYIDEFRISNIARWTSNFTPPTSAYDVAPAITTNPGSWITGISSSVATAGTCQPQFNAGTFSSAPVCTVSALNSTAASYANNYQAASTSQAYLKNVVSGSAADGEVYLMCQ